MYCLILVSFHVLCNYIAIIKNAVTSFVFLFPNFVVTMAFPQPLLKLLPGYPGALRKVVDCQTNLIYPAKPYLP